MRISAKYKALDQIDLKILSELQRDARITKIKLAEVVGLSPTPCSLRIEHLEKIGAIRGYHAHIDLVRLVNVSTFIVEIYMNDYVQNSEKFAQAIKKIPNIVECIAVLGTVDFVLKVVSETIDEYQAIMKRLLDLDLSIVDYRTYPVSNIIKRESSVIVKDLVHL